MSLNPKNKIGFVAIILDTVIIVEPDTALSYETNYTIVLNGNNFMDAAVSHGFKQS